MGLFWVIICMAFIVFAFLFFRDARQTRDHNLKVICYCALAVTLIAILLSATQI